MKIEFYNENDQTQTYWVCCTDWNKRVMYPTEGVFQKIKGRYSSQQFYKLKKDGTPYATGISMRPYDSWQWESLEVFDTEVECIVHFLSECNKKIKYFQNEKRKITHAD